MTRTQAMKTTSEAQLKQYLNLDVKNEAGINYDTS